MTPAQHKTAAEGYLSAASTYLAKTPGSSDEAEGLFSAATIAVSLAQAHATLALVPVETDQALAEKVSEALSKVNNEEGE